MFTRKRVAATLASLAALSLVAAACGDDDDGGSGDAATTTAAGSATTAGATTTAGSGTTAGGGAATTAPAMDYSALSGTLDGSGATFPKAFYEEMIALFKEVAPGVTVNYAGGGSGKGRQDLADQIVQWAGTDSPVKDEDLPGFKGGELLYFPTVVAPITISYNLSGVEELNLSCEVVADIFQLKITNWNDPKIAADNPDAELPDLKITPAVRSDSSGTTDNFSKFLDRGCGTEAGGPWALKTGSTIEWPAGVSAGNGNSGVAQVVKDTSGAIGYVDLSDADATGLTTAAVKNKAGQFVEPTLEGASAAAEGAEIGDDLTFSSVWAEGEAAYPITAQTWIIVYKEQPNKEQGEAIKGFLEYILTEGQTVAPEVLFAPLPGELDKQALENLENLVIPSS